MEKTGRGWPRKTKGAGDVKEFSMMKDLSMNDYVSSKNLSDFRHVVYKLSYRIPSSFLRNWKSYRRVSAMLSVGYPCFTTSIRYYWLNGTNTRTRTSTAAAMAKTPVAPDGSLNIHLENRRCVEICLQGNGQQIQRTSDQFGIPSFR